MTFFDAGLGPKQVTRMVQWMVGIPIVLSFLNALLEPLLQLGLYDPLLDLVMTLLGVTEAWWAYLVLGGIAFLIELSDKALVQADHAYEVKIHEVVKNIGDRLRAGAAIETAVTETCRATSGPSEVFEHAIDLSAGMPFELALREAADTCGNDYLREVCHLVAEAVSSEGDTGGAIRRLGMELERNHQYSASVVAKIANPMMVLRGVSLFAVPALYSLLRASFTGFSGSADALEPGATLFFTYGAVAVTVFDGLIFGQWDRLFARMPLAFAAVYLLLTWMF